MTLRRTRVAPVTFGDVGTGKRVRYYDHFRRTELVVTIESEEQGGYLVKEVATGQTFFKGASTEVLEVVTD